MREILFRGKSLNDGFWVEGAFCMKDCDTPFGELTDRPSIIKYDRPRDGFWFRVNPETVGQFTGLTDKNGKKIFEGDILEYNSRLVNIASGLPTGGNCTERSVVEWDGHRWSRKRIYHSQWNSNWRNYGFTTDLYPENAAKYAEVIGNIHDNPELLEEV